MILRKYQTDLVNDIRAAFASGLKSVCAVAPTGAGKSLVFKEIAQLASAKNKSVCIVVHRDTLLRQAYGKMDDAGATYGIIAAGYTPRRRELIQIASAQSLVRRLENHEFDLLIFDEAHLSCAPTWRKLIDRWSKAHVLGFTATPVLMGGRGLDSVYQKLVIGPTIRGLIDDGFLVEPIAYGPVRTIDISGVRTRSGDYDLQDLEKIVDTPKIMGDVIAEVSKICPGVPTMIFCLSIQHSKDVAEAFSAAGLRATSVDGKMDRREIRDRIAGLSDGRYQYLSSCDLLGIGFDAPAVSCAISLRHTKSLGLYIQQAGRALRPVYAPGYDLNTRAGRLASIAASVKPKAFLLDHVGNFIRHGLVDDEREWFIEGKKKRKGGETKAIAIRQCPKCAMTHRTAPKCPQCGWVYEIAPKDPNVVDGTLSPIDKIALRRAKWKEVAQARTPEALHAIAKARGYHPQWAYHILRERAAKQK